jgi:replicative DNA helicase
MQSIATVDFATAKETVRNLYLNFQKRDLDAVQVRNLAVVGREVLEQHDQLQRQSSLTPGIPYGIEYLDCVSGGMHLGDAITIVARPGVGKSQLALWIALHANVFAGRRVMFATMEMPVKQCAARLLGIAAGVKTSSIRLGRMSFHAKARVQERLDSLIENGSAESFLFVEGGMSRQVEDIIAMCRERRPDVMFIDGAYLLRTEVKRAAKWEVVTEVAEQIKSCALKMNIPIVAMYQFSKKGPKEGLAGIGLSDAVGQLGSFVIGLELLHNTRYDVEIRGSILKGREGERGWFEYCGNKITNVIRQTAYDRSVLFALTLDTEAESTSEASALDASGGDDAFLGGVSE